MNKKNILLPLLIALVSACLFIPLTGRVHLFDWDEINFAESAREMIFTHDYLNVRINFVPFWEKPPLFIWFQVMSMKIFGINEFAARFPNAVCGIATLLVLFFIGKRLYNTRFAMLWALAYASSLLPFFYFKSGIIDPWFNLFTFLGVAYWVFAIENKINSKKYLYGFLSALFLGLAILTKGPVSILVFGLLALCLMLLNGLRIGLNWKQISLFILSLTFVGGFWFLLQILTGNYSVIRDFIVYQIRLFNTHDAGHGGFPFYHFIILLFGVFPASIFAIQGHKYKGTRDLKKVFHTSMIALLWIVLLLFSIVKTKIVHYSSLTYFPLTYLAAYSGYNIIEKKFRFRSWQKIVLGIIGIFLGIIVVALPWLYRNRSYFISKGWITDTFVVRNLQAETHWSTFISLIGILLISGIIVSFVISRRHKLASVVTLYVASLLFVYLSILFITSGAEKISQNAAIEFIKEKAGKDVYVNTFYKSFAPLFYSEQKPPDDLRIFDLNWLTRGDIDKDVYLIHKIHKKEEVLARYPELKFLYEKNGYVFFERKAKTITTE